MRTSYLVIFALAFTILQLFFAVDGVGLEFRGSEILFAPFGPYGLNWLLLLFAIYWIPRANNTRGTIVVCTLMLLHYLITFSYVVVEIREYQLLPDAALGLGRVLARRPEVLWYGSLSYFLGNAWIWILFRNRRRLPPMPFDISGNLVSSV